MSAAYDLIRGFEGFRANPYWDVNAYRAGYGSDTMTTADGRVVPISTGMTVSRDDAERDLARRVDTEFMPRAISAVGQAAWGHLNDQQRAALTSITYNYGELPAPVASAIQAGDLAGAEQAIRALAGHNGGVNEGRRNKEADLFSGRSQAPSTMEADGPANPDRRLAWAYANGRMSPEDAALYEQGMEAGDFPKAGKKEDRPDPLAGLASATERRRAPVALAPISIAPISAPAQAGQGIPDLLASITRAPLARYRGI